LPWRCGNPGQAREQTLVVPLETLYSVSRKTAPQRHTTEPRAKALSRAARRLALALALALTAGERRCSMAIDVLSHHRPYSAHL